MSCRLSGMISVVIICVIAAVGAPLVAPLAAGAAAENFTLTLTDGALRIRGSAEPAALPTGTQITGTNTDGALTAGTFTVPPIFFTQRITDPAPTDVHIEAGFSLVAPNSLTGTVDPDGVMRVMARLKVELKLQVALLPSEVFQCSASPVVLSLEGHYDEGSVTLVDSDFSVPTVPVTDQCMAVIANGINSVLQGAGHSLSLTMAGELTVPLHPGEATTTTLAVSPVSGSALGDEVTFSATVVPSPEAENSDIPTGIVEFRDGSSIIGRADLDDSGIAVLVSDALVAGPRRLSAHYLGAPPVYAASSSAVVAYSVSAPPMVAVDAPAALLIGGASTDLLVTAMNSGFGRNVSAARLEISIRRASGSGLIGPVGVVPRVSISRVNGDESDPVELALSGAGSSQILKGMIDPVDGLPLPADALRSILLRVETSTAIAVGGLQITVILVDVEDGNVLATGSDVIEMITQDRVTGGLMAGVPGLPDFGLPDVPPIIPVRARAGNTVLLTNLRLEPAIVGRPPTGRVHFSVDGRTVSVRPGGSGPEIGWVTDYRLTGGTDIELLLPRDIGPGLRQVAVTYEGDTYYRPAVALFPVMVDPPIGPSYECKIIGPTSTMIRAQVEGRAVLPDAAIPSDVPLEGWTIKLHISRETRSLLVFPNLIRDPGAEIGVTIGSGGGEATGIVEGNASAMYVDEPQAVDYTVTLQQLSGVARINGGIGETVAVNVDEVNFSFKSTILIGGLPLQTQVNCNPVDEPLTIGEVMIAGTKIEAPRLVAVGEEVTIRSLSEPAGDGITEFLANGQTIGLSLTNDGEAAVSTIGLPGGIAEVQAVFYPSGVQPKTTSESVAVRVVETCHPVEEGSGAIVRLAYMELLGRCAEMAGYTYWTEFLNSSLDPDVFAIQISRSIEARGLIVRDAYRLLLDRDPEPDGLHYWAVSLGRSGRYDELLAQIGSSHEFRQLAGGSDRGVVRRLYERIIGRTPDSAGLVYWEGALSVRGVYQVVRTFVNLPEPLNAAVTQTYVRLLGRIPTSVELSSGRAVLHATGSSSMLNGLIVATNDFADRASSFPELN